MCRGRKGKKTKYVGKEGRVWVNYGKAETYITEKLSLFLCFDMRSQRTRSDAQIIEQVKDGHSFAQVYMRLNQMDISMIAGMNFLWFMNIDGISNANNSNNLIQINRPCR